MKLQGVYGEQKSKKVANLQVGDITKWNFGYMSEVVAVTWSKSGKTATVSLRSMQDGIIRDRKMNTNTEVAIA